MAKASLLPQGLTPTYLNFSPIAQEISSGEMSEGGLFICIGGHNGGAGGAQATPGILIFQKQVTLFTKSGDTLELE